MSESEQNKTEEPTDHKLKKAREKGQVAKGQDIVFFGVLLALAIYTLVAGPKLFSDTSQMMRDVFRSSISNASDSAIVYATIKSVYLPAIQALVLLGATLVVAIVLMQLIQLRGLVFSSHPIKPDFNRINPAKGLKRIFSMRTLKEAGKNIVKISIYLGATYLVVIYCVRIYAPTLVDSDGLVSALYGSGVRLLFVYMALSLFFTALDQVIVRKEFTKQMRMSKSEVEREHKDREGDPRQKQKRKKLHAEYIKQTQGLSDLSGSDLIIVNPEHYAVALAYDDKNDSSPVVRAKGRNKIALEIKRRAAEMSIPIFPSPALARALYKNAQLKKEIPEQYYHDVAGIYLRHYARKTETTDTEAGRDEGSPSSDQI